MNPAYHHTMFSPVSNRATQGSPSDDKDDDLPEPPAGLTPQEQNLWYKELCKRIWAYNALLEAQCEVIRAERDYFREQGAILDREGDRLRRVIAANALSRARERKRRFKRGSPGAAMRRFVKRSTRGRREKKAAGRAYRVDEGLEQAVEWARTREDELEWTGGPSQPERFDHLANMQSPVACRKPMAYGHVRPRLGGLESVEEHRPDSYLLSFLAFCN
ncbi:hypothetical protein BC834DRAFT_360393 [Gloeopeniophorella convolvens]|nr:hypothetical protein BC834DRAFT_360393 [Gloeopeniophorella convolvens]